ncbi:hypothetical protein RyT2_20310 [Pseudolactococcus yaeyamensis]
MLKILNPAGHLIGLGTISEVADEERDYEVKGISAFELKPESEAVTDDEKNLVVSIVSKFKEKDCQIKPIQVLLKEVINGGVRYQEFYVKSFGSLNDGSEEPIIIVV